uniref:Putative permease n=1 Tax=mine drainage metagenome TaxID=410659 RepID=E6PFQ1_9ZZZZ
MSVLAAYIEEALASLWRNRLRSALSLLGTIIGIASTIAVLGLSQAGSRGLEASLGNADSVGWVVFVDRSSDNPLAATLYYRDVARFVARSNGAIASAYAGYFGRPFPVNVGGKTHYPQLHGTDKGDDAMVTLEGRKLDHNDVLASANVAMISKEARKILFPHEDPVGRSISVGNARLRIVGVFDATGSLLSSAVGDAIYVPYTTMHRIAPGPIDGIFFYAAPGTTSAQVSAAASAALKSIHGPHAKYTIQDQAKSLGIFSHVLGGIGIGITLIGGIALCVAGIGIMNIMLVSVNERTREIGIRKSIGASSGDISLQFLIEATILSAIGGAIGTIFGVAIVLALQGSIVHFVGSAPVPWALVLSIAAFFTIGIGIGFGAYPAIRAGKLDPVVALRS